MSTLRLALKLEKMAETSQIHEFHCEEDLLVIYEDSMEAHKTLGVVLPTSNRKLNQHAEIVEELPSSLRSGGNQRLQMIWIWCLEIPTGLLAQRCAYRRKLVRASVRLCTLACGDGTHGEGGLCVPMRSGVHWYTLGCECVCSKTV